MVRDRFYNASVPLRSYAYLCPLSDLGRCLHPAEVPSELHVYIRTRPALQGHAYPADTCRHDAPNHLDAILYVLGLCLQTRVHIRTPGGMGRYIIDSDLCDDVHATIPCVLLEVKT